MVIEAERRRDWIRAVRGGLIMAAVLGGGALLFGHGVPAAIVGALVGGAVAGIMSFRSDRALRDQADRAREALGFDLTPSVRRDALRGAPAVDEPSRRRQLAVVDHVLTRLQSATPRNVIVSTVLAGLQVVQALTSSPWFWPGAAFFGVLALSTPWVVRRLRKRQALLSSAL